MEPDLSMPTSGAGAQRPGRTARILAARGDGAPARSARLGSPARTAPALTLRSVSIRTHTLVLTGELTRSSVVALEREIERLCDEGVSAITLDLRRLEQIDSTGVAVIAFRARLCERQGVGFSLVPGSRFIQRAFEQAGVLEATPLQEDEITVRRLLA
jgi:anti-anti-sigma factor